MARVWRKPGVADTGPALLLGAATLAFSGEGAHQNAEWWLITVAALAALVLWRRSPLVTFAAGVLAALGHLALLADPSPVDVTALVGLFSIAAGPTLRVSLVLLVAGVATAGAWTAYAGKVNSDRQVAVPVMVRTNDGPTMVPRLPEMEPPPPPPVPRPPDGVVNVAVGPQLPTWGGFPVLALALVLAWLAGRNSWQRRTRLAGLVQRAEDLEHERDTQAVLAVAAERARISRELHDVVAHALSVVVLQAQGGAAELAHRPERTRQALGDIADTGRTALAETRRLLGALGQDADWDPAPGTENVPGLVARVRAAGTPVDLRVEGDPCPLPTTVDLAAYRIAQEALTNVMKHAGAGSSAAIVLRYTPTDLQIEVTDNGSANGDEPVAGHGLRGMRERVSVLGGTFRAAPRPAGGFAVEATLPLAESRS